MEAAVRRVSEVMRTEFTALRAGDRLDLVDQVMKLGRVRHLPVLDEAGRVLGIVSNRDLLEASLTNVLAFAPDQRRSFLHSVGVDEVMTRDIETIAPEETLASAANRMVGHKIGCLPVVGPDGVMVGLITETDLLAAAFSRPPG